jgi:hypothetical protein
MIGRVLSVVLTLALPSIASADLACVKDKISTEEAEDAAKWDEPMKDIAAQLGFFRKITVVPCDFARGVLAYAAPKGIDGIVEGTEYLIYNPTYLRNISGGDPYQVTFILGHEIGHFINNHLLLSDGVLSKEMELEADYQGSCAVARSGGTFAQALDVIKRLRKQQDESYPTLDESADLASLAFDVCSAKQPKFQWVLLGSDVSPLSEKNQIILELWGDWLKLHSNVTLRMFCTVATDNSAVCEGAFEEVKRELIFRGAGSNQFNQRIWSFNERPQAGLPNIGDGQVLVVFSAPTTVWGVLRRNNASVP